mgnify:CR=1 FL=1
MKKRFLWSLLVFSFILISSCTPKTLENCKGQECIDVCKQDFDECEAFCTADKDKCPQEVIDWYEEVKSVLTKAPDEIPIAPKRGLPERPPFGQPDEEMLKRICKEETWPADCNMIPVPQGVEMCKRCKSIFKNGCSGKGAVRFTSPPRRLEDIEMILPLGMMSEQHITPTDHQYHYTHNWNPKPTPSDLRDVLAPADGLITLVQRLPSWTFYSGQGLEDYELEIYHTCTFYTRYIHLLKLSSKIKNAIGDLAHTENVPVSIPVKAGEVLGGATALDFSVHDSEVTLKGFIIPDHYEGERWKIHTVDPYDYFNDPIRAELIGKTMRKEQPYGGKIDYDIDGKLVGNWFAENSGGYSGAVPGTYGYWSNHLAITYDAIDPSHIILSVGTFKFEGDDKGRQFGIKGNSPDPATIDKNSGMVKYELVGYDYKDDTGKTWDWFSYASNLKSRNRDAVEGIVLVQMLEDRKIKFEAFPGKTASQVNEFTGNAKIYER